MNELTAEQMGDTVMDSKKTLKRGLAMVMLALPLFCQPCLAAEPGKAIPAETNQPVVEMHADGLLPPGPLLTPAQLQALEAAAADQTPRNEVQKAVQPELAPEAPTRVALQII